MALLGAALPAMLRMVREAPWRRLPVLLTRLLMVLRMAAVRMVVLLVVTVVIMPVSRLDITTDSTLLIGGRLVGVGWVSMWSKALA